MIINTIVVHFPVDLKRYPAFLYKTHKTNNLYKKQFNT